MTKDETLGKFIDRYTFQYEREYPHPPERLWEALTAAEHVDAWFMPHNRIEARLGGKFHFTFGGDPDPDSWSGTIVEFTPPEVVDYAFDHGGHMRFELRRLPGGTKLYFTQSFSPDFVHTDGLEGPALGADLPGGPGTPWRPGFMAGYHISLTRLGEYVAGNGPTREEALAATERGRAGTHFNPVWSSLVVQYRTLVAERIPRE